MITNNMCYLKIKRRTAGDQTWDDLSDYFVILRLSIVEVRIYSDARQSEQGACTFRKCETRAPWLLRPREIDDIHSDQVIGRTEFFQHSLLKI